MQNQLFFAFLSCSQVPPCPGQPHAVISARAASAQSSDAGTGSCVSLLPPAELVSWSLSDAADHDCDAAGKSSLPSQGLFVVSLSSDCFVLQNSAGVSWARRQSRTRPGASLLPGCTEQHCSVTGEKGPGPTARLQTYIQEIRLY